MKQNFTKIRWIYWRKKNLENRKKSNFWKIFLFLSNFLEYYFRLVWICRYETPCIYSYSIGELWKQISQKSAAYIGVKKIVKIGKSQIFGRFSQFNDFFTAIKSADFCEIRFHGSPIPYERTQGVSYLQIEANQK